MISVWDCHGSSCGPWVAHSTLQRTDTGHTWTVSLRCVSSCATWADSSRHTQNCTGHSESSSHLKFNTSTWLQLLKLYDYKSSFNAFNPADHFSLLQNKGWKSSLEFLSVERVNVCCVPGVYNWISIIYAYLVGSSLLTLLSLLY